VLQIFDVGWLAAEEMEIVIKFLLIFTLSVKELGNTQDFLERRQSPN